MDTLAQLLDRRGPWTYAYVDGRGAEPTAVEDARHAALLRALEEAGAPPEDVDAVAEVTEGSDGTPSPSTRYVLVHDGAVRFDEHVTGARLGPEQIGHGPVPPILPYLRHAALAVSYLLVETARDGARVQLATATRGEDRPVEIEGDTHHLTKVRAGGWSHRRMQAHTEDVWRRNQSEVAQAVDTMVREERPRLVVLAGDVRARQLLRDQLGAEARDRLVDVDVHTKAEGADDSAVDEAIAQAVDDAVRDDIVDAVARASVSGGAGARGPAEVVDALQQARVETLVLDARMLDEDATVLALDAAPWVAGTEADAVGAFVVGHVPLAEGLARAAVLTDARVLVVEDDSAEDGSEAGAASDPIASLRWT